MREGKVLKPEVIKRGYLRYVLSKNGVRRKILGHVIVLKTFVGECPEGMESCHWNGVHSDNRITNLRYDTRSNNVRDNIRNGVHPWLTADGKMNGNPNGYNANKRR